MRRSWTARDEAVMRMLHECGDSSCEIAEWLGFDRSTIKRRLRQAGLKPKLEKVCWTADMDQTLRINYPAFPAFLIAYVLGLTYGQVQNRAHSLGLKKAPDFWSQPNARLWNSVEHPNSIASRIKPGATPPNKGLRRPGWAPGRMADTQFKKGCMSGAAQHNYQPVGTLRIDTKDGYLERKVTDDHPVPARRWVAVHRLVWEAANGPIPPGHRVAFRPGTKTNVLAEITPDKLELVTAADVMRRNTIHNYPTAIKDAMRMRGVLNRSIRKAEKRNEANVR